MALWTLLQDCTIEAYNHFFVHIAITRDLGLKHPGLQFKDSRFPEATFAEHMMEEDDLDLQWCVGSGSPPTRLLL
ncbi:hypothetical protein J6590_024102 [Homalodisca vitripennis]|nr:hypothetical protein J6590_024102 [Homalodisca vitripennis]